jgi:DNA-binding NtrC family response regulator
VVRRAAILGDGVILREHLRDAVRDPRLPSGGVLPAEAGTTLPDMVEELEVRMITQACSKADGNKSRAAEMLGLSRFALQRKLEKYGIDPDQPGRAPERDA